jgi:hypothetical protein
MPTSMRDLEGLEAAFDGRDLIVDHFAGDAGIDDSGPGDDLPIAGVDDEDDANDLTIAAR